MIIDTVIQIGDTNVFVQTNHGQIIVGTDKPIPKELTALPAVKDMVFIGRESKLNEMKTVVTTVQGNKIVQLFGFGGIGKTTIAENYLSRNYPEYSHICYLVTYDTIIKTFATNIQLTDALVLNQETKGKSMKQRFELITGRMRQLKGRNLLIIDNAGQDLVYSEIYNAIMLTYNWDIIVTAREKLENCSHIEVDELSPADAQVLFYSHYTYERDDLVVGKILELIEYHTLTIEVVAKTSDQRIFKLSEVLDIVKKKPFTFQISSKRVLKLKEVNSEILTSTENFYLKFLD